MAKAAQAAHSYDGGQQVNMKKYGVYGTDYGSECQHVLQQTPPQVRIVFHSMGFLPFAAWLCFRNTRYSCSPSTKTGGSHAVC